MFHDKNVVVTGAGRGIGPALALAFAEQGANMLIHYGHAQHEAEEAVRRITATGGQAMLAQADLSRPEEAYLLASQVVAMLLPIDLWLNNRGPTATSAET